MKEFRKLQSEMAIFTNHQAITGNDNDYVDVDFLARMTRAVNAFDHQYQNFINQQYKDQFSNDKTEWAACAVSGNQTTILDCPNKQEKTSYVAGIHNTAN